MAPLIQSKRTRAEAALQRLEATEGGPFTVVDQADVAAFHFDLPAAALRIDPRLELDADRHGDAPQDSERESARAVARVLAYTVVRVRSGLEGRMTERAGSPWVGRTIFEIGLCVRHAGEPGVLLLAQVCPEALEGAVGDRRFGKPVRFGTTSLQFDASRGTLDCGVALPGSKSFMDRPRLALAGQVSDEPRQEGETTGEEFLLERYTNFTVERGLLRLERCWRSPTAALPVAMRGEESQAALVDVLGIAPAAAAEVTLVGGYVLPGVSECRIGRPRCMQGPACATRWPIEVRQATRAEKDD
ncbi:MAG: hypothetical protein NTW19_09625 [Planctomycetota bacterium]|nr:hypothetical protein [Planctomycetota bacterium]